LRAKFFEFLISNFEFAIATVPICPDVMTLMELLSEGAVLCPYCGETFSTMVDTSQSSHATIEDCPVCCRPIQLTVECEPGEVLSIDAQPG
jgi:hypothetical protein